jgi:ABC-2 type transport system ATP-binding protein
MASPAGLQGLFELYLSKVQGISVYRRVASSLRTGIEIREADEEDMRLVHDWLNPGQVENTISENLHETCFVAKRGSRVTGCVYLVRRPEQAYPHDGYWLINLMVRTLYRGMGIGEELSRMVMEKSRKERAKGLSLLVNEYNHRAIRLYRKLGFEMRVIPALERELEHERCTLGYRRVLMFACLGGEDERRPFGVVLPQSQPNADKADTKSGQTLLACERKTDNVSLAISIVNLTKRFPRTSGYRDLLPFRQKQWVTAVDNVSLDINEGEFFGLLGPNGAGKTTLIKVLCSLVIPNSGTAQIFGHDILSEEQAVKKLVGLVSAEERSFFWRLTGRDNLQFYASLYNLTQQQAKKRIDELLNLVGLVDESDIRFQNYSTGMRQKLAIARGLLSYPRVLFVDEPTKSLDPVSAKAVRRFLKEKVAAEGKTVVLATHNLTEAEQLCDRLAIMDHGRVIALGSIQELRSLFKKHEGCELQVRHFSDTILPQLRLINGVLDCRLTSQHDGVSSLELRISDRWTVLPQILQIMVHSGAGVCDCQLRELPLEEIFVNILSGSATKESN